MLNYIPLDFCVRKHQELVQFALDLFIKTHKKTRKAIKKAFRATGDFNEKLIPRASEPVAYQRSIVNCAKEIMRAFRL